jgi:hypothetical protein
MEKRGLRPPFFLDALVRAVGAAIVSLHAPFFASGLLFRSFWTTELPTKTDVWVLGIVDVCDIFRQISSPVYNEQKQVVPK